MEEEQKGEFFQTPTQFESDRLNKPASSNSKKKYIIIAAIVLVAIIVIFGAMKIFKGGSSSNDSITPAPTAETFPTDTPFPTEATTPTSEAPSATPKPTSKPASNPVDKASGLDRSKLAIEVLNGSGVAGVSKKGGDYLTSLGYNVVETSNADNFDYQNVVIRIKASQNKYLSLLKSDLSANYTIGSTSADLDESGRNDAVVIIGK